VVTRQLQIERRTEKVRRPKTDVLPLSHATNLTRQEVDKRNCSVICTLFKLPLLGSGMNMENVHSCGHSPVSQVATHILCILSSTVSPPALNSSAMGPHLDFCDLLSDGWHEQPLSEVVEALAPNILVQFLSLLRPGTVQVFTASLPSVSDLCSFSQIFASRSLDTLRTWLELSSH